MRSALAAFMIASFFVASPPAQAAGCSSESCDVSAGTGLEPAEFDALIQAWLQRPMDEPSKSLETLLFHGARTRELLSSAELPEDRRAYLQRQLERDTVSVAMRLVDARGSLRGEALAEDIPLVSGRRIAFEGTGDLGFLVTGGKVKRVGLEHLWSRW